MLYTLLSLTLLAALFWLARLLSPNSRAAGRYRYNAATDPAALNGTIPHDPAPAACAPDPDSWPAVTVLVPGRNEGHVLADTLGSLCAMDYPNFRVVFIDDQSTDNTPDICRQLQAQYPHLTVLHNTEPPPTGWIGKTWALHQGLALARQQGLGDYLLFVDSDLHFHPQCLTQMIRLARHRNTDLVSLLPFCHCHSLGEKIGLMMALQLIALKFPLRESNNPAKKNVCIVAGGFSLYRRQAYESLGGHEAVRGQVIEDVALGLLSKSRGLRVYTVGTEDLMTGRMYEGTADTFHGLRKNAFAGAHYNLALALFALLAFSIVGILMPLYLLAALYYWITQPALLTAALLALAIIAFAAMFRTMARANSHLRFHPAIALLTPAAFAFFAAVLFTSILDYYRGGARWAGRQYHPRHVQNLTGVDTGG